nr:bifunctional chorismate mutase/prephenate dehydratase [Gemmatimonadota bacterium]NIU31648.1 bifunctional chorismate mutase/prephenate dehydratase [Gemmatimonadota bacterium]NIW64727.1 bifunctional chorismate mutase/prephenate dehydratase [Gemmatimonadota bacterium]
MSARTPAPAAAPTVAFQGEPGAFSEEAARHLLGENVSTLPKRSFEEVRAAVVAEEADLG